MVTRQNGLFNIDIPIKYLIKALIRIFSPKNLKINAKAVPHPHKENDSLDKVIYPPVRL
jgi:hypothetical protein